jgi:hypothetical protein
MVLWAGKVRGYSLYARRALKRGLLGAVVVVLLLSQPAFRGTTNSGTALPARWVRRERFPPSVVAKRALRAVRTRLPPWPPPSWPTALRALSPPYSLRAVAHRREGICRALLCPLLDFIRSSVRLTRLGTLRAAMRCSPRLAVSVPSAVGSTHIHTYAHAHRHALRTTAHAITAPAVPPPGNYMVRCAPMRESACNAIIPSYRTRRARKKSARAHARARDGVSSAVACVRVRCVRIVCIARAPCHVHAAMVCVCAHCVP